MKNNIFISLSVAILTLTAVPTAAIADSSPHTFYFNVINDDPAPSQTVKDIVESQLYVEVYDYSSSVKFTFHNFNNSGPTSAMVVTEIYFDDDPLPDILDYDNPVITNYDGTNYAISTKNNPNVPEGNAIGFSETGAFDLVNPAPTWDINQESADHGSNTVEQLDISFEYNNDYSYQQKN